MTLIMIFVKTVSTYLIYLGSKKKEKSIDQYKDSCDEGKDQKL